MQDELSFLESSGCLGKRFRFEYNFSSESAGKSEENSAIQSIKKQFNFLNVEKGNKKDDCFINKIPVQIKNEGRSLLCSSNLKNIGNFGKMIGDFRTKEKFVKELVRRIPEIENINFFELSGRNQYFYDNFFINECCIDYFNNFLLMCIYNKTAETVTLYKTIDYMNKKNFYCEIRSSGKNATSLVASDFVMEQLAPYKNGNLYSIEKTEFIDTIKARNKAELSVRIKFNKILPYCFFVDGRQIKEENSRYIFNLNAVKQTIPTIGLYSEDKKS